jgi:hypothetical protein
MLLKWRVRKRAQDCVQGTMRVDLTESRNGSYSIPVCRSGISGICSLMQLPCNHQASSQVVPVSVTFVTSVLNSLNYHRLNATSVLTDASPGDWPAEGENVVFV